MSSLDNCTGGMQMHHATVWDRNAQMYAPKPKRMRIADTRINPPNYVSPMKAAHVCCLNSLITFRTGRSTAVVGQPYFEGQYGLSQTANATILRCGAYYYSIQDRMATSYSSRKVRAMAYHTSCVRSDKLGVLRTAYFRPRSKENWIWCSLSTLTQNGYI